MKKTFLFLFYLLAGIITGSLLGNLCAGIPALSWLGYSNTIGFSANNPAVLNLLIVKITFGFSMTVSVAQIITVSLAMYLYNR
ncbi:MAG: DUF4321 domain-containing protein [Oscillospiraceae bacterium]|nr:DUF4321 domain-containing protein [Oscillospiraceae bacterium]